jgi:phytoene dehydrogenase-like protein
LNIFLIFAHVLAVADLIITSLLDYLGKMKVNIIGGGIAGLSAGCFLQMKGIETEIFESQSKAGGLCTSWKKGAYTFDGCLHWLLGSTNKNPFYNLWSELVDMDSIRFVNHDIRMDIEVKNNKDKYSSTVFHLYTNLEKLEQYMCDIAPEDAKHIHTFILSTRKIQCFEIPPMINEVPALLPLKQKIKYVKYLPLLLYLFKWQNVTNYSFARKFKNPFLKEAFQLFFDGDELPLIIMSMPMANYDINSAGYPVGGSSLFTQKILDKYISLGGKIRYNSKVDKIICENNSAKAIELKDGIRIESDITVSAADWHETVFNFLEGKYVNKTITALGQEKKLPVFYSVFMVSLGVNGSFKDQPHMIRFPLKTDLISPDGTKYPRLEVHIYNYDPTLAPDGKTVISLTLYTKQGDYWINLRKSDPEQYKKVKEEFANKLIKLVDEKIGGIASNIEEMDVATPATFNRYTNNWKGSIQGWLPGKKLMAIPPVEFELPGLKNFYYCGHWSVPGGGLPVAVKSARDVAMIICKKNNIEF